ncbi:MAG TPA: sigma-54-dependent Fis family transcriptional regulator [Gammaproteobacteria bacterium]|nr:sigma-54-dependent Fis family transcriptional regulator [Gammaproteobacteria bacterium]
MGENIIVIEDEETLRNNLATFLTRRGYCVSSAASGQEGIRRLQEQSFDILITDIYLPDIDGIEILNQLRSLSMDTTPLVMTAFGSIESAIEAFQCGAHDYLLKPFSFEDLAQKLGNIAAYRQAIQENRRLRARVHGKEESTHIIHRSSSMRELLTRVRKLASLRCNVLITGETGTGKELVARALHEYSPRRENPFLSFNVAAIPEELMESHLFGHRRGAFTGAHGDRDGFFLTAAGGTLFLDEIGELPRSMQAKLLRAVEEKEILPVGSDQTIHVDTRIIAATHRDLEAMVENGNFRRDLLMRLDVVQLSVPPLRERKEDIPLLAQHFIALHAAEMGKTSPALHQDALNILLGHDWGKGNIRELSNVIERAVIDCEGDTITPDHLAPTLGSAGGSGYADLRSAVREFERRYISSVLESAEGDRDLAARILGISVATLYRHLH